MVPLAKKTASQRKATARKNYTNRKTRVRTLQQDAQPEIIGNLYLELEITNTSDTIQQLVLFDSNQSYQFQRNYKQSASLKIRGISKNYPLTVNKIVGGKFRLGRLHLETLVGKETQFSEPISMYEDSMSANDTTLIESIYPSKGINSGQYQSNRQELPPIDYLVTANTAMVTNILPQNKLILRFFFDEIRYS